MTHAPHELRMRARDVVLREAEEHGFAVHGFGKVTEWRAVMAASRASLAPRGFGRTSYHLMETLQMGLLPVYVRQAPFNMLNYLILESLTKSLLGKSVM